MKKSSRIDLPSPKNKNPAHNKTEWLDAHLLSLCASANEITRTTAHTHTGDVVVGADPLRQEPVADLPGEDRRTLPLVLRDLGDHLRSGDPRLAAAYGPGPYGAGLVISAQDLAHAAVGHLGGKQKTQITYIIYDYWRNF